MPLGEAFSGVGMGTAASHRRRAQVLPVPAQRQPVKSSGIGLGEGLPHDRFVRDEMEQTLGSDVGRVHTCACGCGRLVVDGSRGRPRRFATAACREAARRRRRAGLPEDFRRRRGSRGRVGFRREPVTMDLLRGVRERLLETARRRGVSNLRVFGSVARGEATLHSDVDLLLDLEPDRSMLDLGGFAEDVSDLLDSRVDVVEEDALSGRMRERVLAEALPL